jgi:threonine synthase
VDAEATVVAVLTGLGLKDPDTGMRLADPNLEAEPTVEAVRDVLGW